MDPLEINDYESKTEEIESYCTHIIINNTVNRVSEPVLLKTSGQSGCHNSTTGEQQQKFLKYAFFGGSNVFYFRFDKETERERKPSDTDKESVQSLSDQRGEHRPETERLPLLVQSCNGG